MLEGVIQDERSFYFMAELDEEDDDEDPSVWIKANPSLGVMIQRGQGSKNGTRTSISPPNAPILSPNGEHVRPAGERKRNIRRHQAQRRLYRPGKPEGTDVSVVMTCPNAKDLPRLPGISAERWAGLCYRTPVPEAKVKSR